MCKVLCEALNNSKLKFYEFRSENGVLFAVPYDLAEHREQRVKQDAQLWPRIKHLMSIKGVGIHTIAVVIAETNGFVLFENIGQLCSYVGYDVVEQQSGSYQSKVRISKRGNSHIRRALHMSSLSLLRFEVPVFYPLYERVLERTNVKMKAIVAIQRKLLTILYTLWKKQEDFNPLKLRCKKK